MTAGALERIVRRTASHTREPATERCGLCSTAVRPDGHAHVLDQRQDDLLCVCRACALLFEREAASQGRYRLVPERRIRLTGVEPADFGVPVGLAFFVLRSDGAAMAHYPSPLGATQWEVDAAVWRAALEKCPPLRSMEPSVEALLVNTARGAIQRWLVPVSDCYRLVAVVRREWRGAFGGTRVWTEIERFFDGLAPSTGGREDGRTDDTTTRRNHG